MIRGKGILKEKSGKQEAIDFCDKIGRSCGSLLDINIDVLQRNRESGLVSHDITGKDFDPWEMENAIRNSEKLELLLHQQLPRGITPPNMISRTPT